MQEGVANPSHLTGPFLVDPVHPLLRGVTLDGVVWSMDESATDTAAENSVTLVFAGETPLVTETLDPNGARHWRLHMDPELSNLGRSADWPILLANAAEERRSTLPGPVATSLSLGERFQWRGAPDGPMELVSPDGKAHPLKRTNNIDVVTPRLDQVGLWSLRKTSGDLLQTFGVSLASAGESDLSTRSAQVQPALDPSQLDRATKRGAGDSWVEAALMLAALALLALNWWVLRERMPAQARSNRP